MSLSTEAWSRSRNRVTIATGSCTRAPLRRSADATPLRIVALHTGVPRGSAKPIESRQPGRRRSRALTGQLELAREEGQLPAELGAVAGVDRARSRRRPSAASTWRRSAGVDLLDRRCRLGRLALGRHRARLSPALPDFSSSPPSPVRGLLDPRPWVGGRRRRCGYRRDPRARSPPARRHGRGADRQAIVASAATLARPDDRAAPGWLRGSRIFRTLGTAVASSASHNFGPMAQPSAAPANPEASILATVHHLRPVPDPKPPPSPIEGEAPSIRQLERWATVLRMDCVRMLAVAKSGHLDSSLSAADIVTALYNRVLRHDPANPGWEDAIASCSPRATRRRSSTRRSPATTTSRSRT